MPRLFDRKQIRARLRADRVWAAYALADLEPRYFPFASWYAPEEDAAAIALLYRAFDRPILILAGETRHLERLLDELEVELRDAAAWYAVVKPDSLQLLEDRWQVGDRRAMLRMVLDKPSGLSEDQAGCARLGETDLEAVRRLYADGIGSGEAPEFFLPSMLRHGVYYGIAEGGNLAAAGGTHVLAPDEGVAGLGNLYTLRARRRRGYGTRIAAALTLDLSAMGLETIVLNVRDDNHGAIRIYEKLGFRVYCSYWEAQVFGEDRNLR